MVTSSSSSSSSSGFDTTSTPIRRIGTAARPSSSSTARMTTTSGARSYAVDRRRNRSSSHKNNGGGNGALASVSTTTKTANSLTTAQDRHAQYHHHPYRRQNEESSSSLSLPAQHGTFSTATTNNNNPSLPPRSSHASKHSVGIDGAQALVPRVDTASSTPASTEEWLSGPALSPSIVRRWVSATAKSSPTAAASSNGHNNNHGATLLNSSSKKDATAASSLSLFETSRQAGEAAAAVLGSAVKGSSGSSSSSIADRATAVMRAHNKDSSLSPYRHRDRSNTPPKFTVSHGTTTTTTRSQHSTTSAEPPPRYAITTGTTSSSQRERKGSLGGSSHYTEDEHSLSVASTTRGRTSTRQEEQQQDGRLLLNRLERISQRNNNLAEQHCRSYELRQEEQQQQHYEEEEEEEHHSQQQQQHLRETLRMGRPESAYHAAVTKLMRQRRASSSRSPLRSQKHKDDQAFTNEDDDYHHHHHEASPQQLATATTRLESSSSNPSWNNTSAIDTRDPPLPPSHHHRATEPARVPVDEDVNRTREQHRTYPKEEEEENEKYTISTVSAATKVAWKDVETIHGGKSNNDTMSVATGKRQADTADSLRHDDGGDGWNDRPAQPNTMNGGGKSFEEKSVLVVPEEQPVVNDGDNLVDISSSSSAPADPTEQQLLLQTVEDVEPEVDQLHMDAACLKTESVVRLQPYHVHNGYSQQCNGGMTEPSAAVPEQLTLHAISSSAPVLCYGAIVRLHATTTSASSSSTNNSNNNKEEDKISCVGVVEATNQVCVLKKKKDKKVGGSNDLMLLWQVFRGDSSAHLIQVGLSVANTQRPPVKSTLSTVTAPIHSGDPILLRHVATGGLLSFFSGEWRILTDSYQQEEEPPPSSDALLPLNIENRNKIPLNRLRDHNLIVPSINEVFAFVLDAVPWTTAWIHGGPLACRKYLARSYLRFPGRLEQQAENKARGHNEIIDGMDTIRQQQTQSMKRQEQLLVDELLGSFLGLEGTYLQAKVFDLSDSSLQGQRMHFILQEGENILFDRGLRALIEGMIPLANGFVLLEEFIAKRLHRFEYGSVMQALCACLDGMMQDYSSFISGVEDDYRRVGTMSLRELQVVCQSWLEKFSVLSAVVFATADRKGGSLINGLRHLLIHQYQGNEVAEELLRTLLDEASKPFMSMLQEWLENGILDDPYGEFMVQCRGEADWDVRYTLDNHNTLQHFFPTPVEAERVLSAGKYWDAVRVCHDESILGTETATPSMFSLQYHVNGAQVASHIQNLYSRASQALVRLLMGACDLIGTFQLLKRYFLLDQGDFFLNFLDVAEEELSRDPSKLRQFRIQHLLQVSVPIIENRIHENHVVSPLQQHLRLSSADLACRFAPDSLVDQMDRIHNAAIGGDGGEGASTTPQRLVYGAAGQPHPTRTGVDLFLLEFTEVPFPLSLILSDSNLANYRLLFRHLFFAKHVERKLVMVWQDHLTMKEFTSVRGPMGSTYLLRQRMLHCVQNLIYYMMFEVIEPNWLQMIAKISAPSKDKTVDEIMGIHCEFLDQTLEACLLTSRDFVLAFTRVMQTCLLFSKQMETFIKKVRLHQDRHQAALENLNRIQHNLHARGSGLADTTTTVSDQMSERQRRVQAQTRRVEREVSSPEFQRMIAHYESTFTKHLRAFMSVLIKSDDKYHTQKVNLCIRLDYNGFVTRSMGLLRTSR